MTVGVIYGAQSGIVLRVIASDDTSSFNNHLRQGEAILYLIPKSKVLPEIIAEAQISIAQTLGKRAVDTDRCAVVRQDGTVSHFIKADPLISTPPTGTELVTAYDRSITTACTYDKRTGLFTAPEVKRLAGTFVKTTDCDRAEGCAKVMLLQDVVIAPARVIEKPTT